MQQSVGTGWVGSVAIVPPVENFRFGQDGGPSSVLITVPDAEMWEVVLVGVQGVSNSGNSDRSLQIALQETVDSFDVDVFRVVSTLKQSANFTVNYSFFNGASPNPTKNQFFQEDPLPVFYALPGNKISIALVGAIGQVNSISGFVQIKRYQINLPQ